MIHLSCLNHSNHTHKPHKTWLENLSVSSTPTRPFPAFSLLKCSLIVRERKGPRFSLRGVLPALQRLSRSLPAHYWPEPAAFRASWLITVCCRRNPTRMAYRRGGNSEDESLQQPDTQGPHHPGYLTHLAHFAVVTRQSPWHLRQWNIRDVYDRYAFAALWDYV